MLTLPFAYLLSAELAAGVSKQQVYYEVNTKFIFCLKKASLMLALLIFVPKSLLVAHFYPHWGVSRY